MLLKDVLLKFGSFPDLPVPVEAVLDFIRSAGIVDRLVIIDVETDVAILRGVFVRERRSGPLYSCELDCVDLLLSTNQEVEWRRLVAVKEALHVFDPAFLEMRNLEDIKVLLKNLALPPSFARASQAASPENALTAFHDRFGEWLAAAVLFPIDARQELLPGYASGALTLPEISNLVHLPLRHVSSVMSDAWPAFHDSMMSFAEAQS